MVILAERLMKRRMLPAFDRVVAGVRSIFTVSAHMRLLVGLAIAVWNLDFVIHAFQYCFESSSSKLRVDGVTGFFELLEVLGIT